MGGSPRKIAPDHKSFPNSRQQQHSPTHTASSRARSAKSPIPNGHVSNSNRLSANHSDRNTSPGHHHHRAVSPKPPSSPLLTPRNATSADVRLNSANRTRKKKTSLSATTPKRWLPFAWGAWALNGFLADVINTQRAYVAWYDVLSVWRNRNCWSFIAWASSEERGQLQLTIRMRVQPKAENQRS